LRKTPNGAKLQLNTKFDGFLRLVRNREQALGVSVAMKALRVVMLGLALVQPNAFGADGGAPTPDAGPPVDGGSASGVGRSQPAVNLIAFVGRKIEVRYIEQKPKPNEWVFDAEFLLRYEVLEVVFGRYSGKEMTFTSYVHTGEPEFQKHKFGLLYVSEHEGRFFHQKYLFQAVYPTADGRWAGCGDSNWWLPPQSTRKAKPEMVAFWPPVVFNTRRMPPADIDKKYPAPFFHHERGKAICVMGNYTPELFQVMKDGPLTARRVFPLPPRPSPEPSNKPMKQTTSPQGHRVE